MLQLKTLIISRPMLATISVLSITVSLSIHSISKVVSRGRRAGKEGRGGDGNEVPLGQDVLGSHFK